MAVRRRTVAADLGVDAGTTPLRVPELLEHERGRTLGDDEAVAIDLESITALNNGLIEFSEVILFTSHDQKFLATVANRIIDVMAEFDCPLFDPQTNERFDAASDN